MRLLHSPKWLMGKVGQSSFSVSQGWLWRCEAVFLKGKTVLSVTCCEEGALPACGPFLARAMEHRIIISINVLRRGVVVPVD